MIIDAIALAVALLGGAFALVAALGLWRMGDVFARLHTTTKAGTLGAGLLVLALALQTGDGAVWARAAVLIAFLIMTGPIAGHAIARAAWRSGMRPKGELHLDDSIKPNRESGKTDWVGSPPSA